MLGKIWFGMMAIGAGWALLSGDTGAFLRAAVSAGEASLSYGLKLAGILGFWLGVMEVAGRSGLVNRLARFTSPLIRWLFPSVPSEDPAASYILLNLTANLLGMGNAATPFGLKAMEELSRLNGGSQRASDAMCTFLALNAACLTLIPTTVLGLRLAFGSQRPAAFLPAMALTGLTGTIVALIVDRRCREGGRYRG